MVKTISERIRRGDSNVKILQPSTMITDIQLTVIMKTVKYQSSSSSFAVLYVVDAAPNTIIHSFGKS